MQAAVVGLSTTCYFWLDCLHTPLLMVLPRSTMASFLFIYFEHSPDHLSSFSAAQISNANEASSLLQVVIIILVIHFLFDLLTGSIACSTAGVFLFHLIGWTDDFKREIMNCLPGTTSPWT